MARTGRTLAEYVQAYREAAGPEELALHDAYREHFRLANQIIGFRRTAGLTQQALAEQTGIGQSEISRIERGVANPTQETLTRLGQALGKRLAFVDG